MSWKLGGLNNGYEIIDTTHQIIAVLDTGQLVLELKNNGCYHYDSLPAVGVFSKDTETKILVNTCNSDSSLFFVDTFNQCYKWFFINTAGSIITTTGSKTPFFITNPGNRPLLVRYNCIDECSGSIVTSRAIKSEHDCNETDTEPDRDWDIRPVPAMDQLTLHSDYLKKGTYTISVFDGLGRTVMSFDFKHQGGEVNIPLEVSGLSAGYFFFRLNDQAKKIIIVK